MLTIYETIFNAEETPRAIAVPAERVANSRRVISVKLSGSNSGAVAGHWQEQFHTHPLQKFHGRALTRHVAHIR